MNYRVIIKKNADKGIRKMPFNVQKKMGLLVDDLKENGPIAHDWPNYSKLLPPNTIATWPVNGLHAGAWKRNP